MAETYTSKYATGAAVDAALDLAMSSIQLIDLAVATGEEGASAGLISADDQAKLDGIEAGATGDLTAQEIANAIDADATAETTLKSALGLGSAAYAATSDFAVAAKGVTNGDSHNHDGGDGAQIAYSSLSGLPTLPSGAIVGTTDTQTLTNKTLTDPVIVGAIAEDVYTITDGAAFEIDPGNGTIQLITLGAARTPKGTNFVAGESVMLMINDQATYAITWTDTTFSGGSGSGIKWVGGSAPTMPDGADSYLVVELWKVGNQVYGARVGEID